MRKLMACGLVTLATTVSIGFFNLKEAYAGDINAYEQDVYNFCCGTYEYNGKYYKASDGALGSLYAKLASDDTDLNEYQAQSAKNIFLRNIGQGVAQGYMIEVSAPVVPTTPANDNDTQTSGDDNNTDNNDVTDKPENTQKPGSDSQVSQKPSKDEGSDSQVSQKPSKDKDNASQHPTDDGEKENQTAKPTASPDKNNETVKPDDNQPTDNQASGNSQDSSEDNIFSEESQTIAPDVYVEDIDIIDVYDSNIDVKNTGYNIQAFIYIAIMTMSIIAIFTLVYIKRKGAKR